MNRAILAVAMIVISVLTVSIVMAGTEDGNASASYQVGETNFTVTENYSDHKLVITSNDESRFTYRIRSGNAGQTNDTFRHVDYRVSVDDDGTVVLYYRRDGKGKVGKSEGTYNSSAKGVASISFN